MDLNEDDESFSSDEPSVGAVQVMTAPVKLLSGLASTISDHGDFYFSDLDMQALEEEAIFISLVVWRLVVGLAGLLDCAAGLVTLMSPEWAKQYAATHWLNRHSNRLGMIFSFFWFCDSILNIYHRQRKSLYHQNTLCPSDCEASSPHQHTVRWYQGLVALSARLLLLQLVVLPVGVYISLYRLVLKVMKKPVWDEATDPIIIHHGGNESTTKNTTALGTDTIISWSLVIMRHMAIKTSRELAEYMSKGRARLLKKLVVFLIQLFLQNPLVFNRRIRMMHFSLGWMKKIARLADKLSQLLQKTRTVRVNFLQWWESTLARRARRHLKRTLSASSLKDYNATVIASAFRRYLAQRRAQVLRKEDDFRQHAALKIQTCVRRFACRNQYLALTDARKLCAVDIEVKSPHGRLDKYANMIFDLDREWRRDIAYLVNERLLIAPECTFSVIWGLLSVLALVSEALSAAINPFLEERAKSAKGLPINLNEFITKHFVPISVTSNPKCHSSKKNIWLRPFHILFCLFTKQKPNPFPWWCRSRCFATLQGSYIFIAKLVIQNYTRLVDIVLFLDVCVVFFTGAKERLSDPLKATPPFRRWIFPGIFFQLIINQHMDQASAFLRKLANFMILRGVIRSYQWCVVSFYPLIYFAISGWSVDTRDCSRVAFKSTALYPSARR